MKNHENADFESLINSEAPETIFDQPGAKNLIRCAFLGFYIFFAHKPRMIAHLIAQLRISFRICLRS